jgi:hypothetical protein
VLACRLIGGYHAGFCGCCQCRNLVLKREYDMGEVWEWTLLSMEVLADYTASFREYWQIYGIIGLACRLIGGCHAGFCGSISLLSSLLVLLRTLFLLPVSWLFHSMRLFARIPGP